MVSEPIVYDTEGASNYAASVTIECPEPKSNFSFDAKGAFLLYQRSPGEISFDRCPAVPRWSARIRVHVRIERTRDLRTAARANILLDGGDDRRVPRLERHADAAFRPQGHYEFRLNALLGQSQIVAAAN